MSPIIQTKSKSAFIRVVHVCLIYIKLGQTFVGRFFNTSVLLNDFKCSFLPHNSCSWVSLNVKLSNLREMRMRASEFGPS